MARLLCYLAATGAFTLRTNIEIKQQRGVLWIIKEVCGPLLIQSNFFSSVAQPLRNRRRMDPVKQAEASEVGDSESTTTQIKSRAAFGCSESPNQDQKGIKSQLLDSLKQIRSATASENLEQKGKTQSFTNKTEEEVGIAGFIDKSPGFSGITKQRWSDFIVHEVDMAGNVVILRSTQVPVVKVETESEVARPAWFPEVLWDQIVSLSSSTDKAGSVKIPVLQLSKEQRTRYHGTIKSSFPGVVSNTTDVDGEKFIVVSKKGSVAERDSTFWKHRPWPKGRPKFLHFTLYKENMDTFAALSMLSLDLKLKSNKFHFAGTKDARAKTTQLVAIKQVTAEKLAFAARKFGRISVGDFCYKDSPLKLGDLKGNQFDIVLRNVIGTEEQIGHRMESFKEQGFINFFGMQRFGATNSSTHLVGRAIIRKEWRTAVDLILSGRPDDHTGTLLDAQRAWLADRDPQRAYALLSRKQQRTTLEGRVLHTLCSVRATAYQEAVDKLPSTSRQLYVHAYQSWLWNRIVSHRLATHGLQVLPGDLVLADRAAVDVDTLLPDGDDPLTTSSLPDDDESEVLQKPVGTTSLPEVRTVTESEVSQYTINDVVLPLPGWAVKYPDNSVRDSYRELLAEDEVQLDSKHYCDTMPQYSLAGAYRHLVVKPQSVSWRLVRYSDPACDLLTSDLDRLRAGRQDLPEPTGDPDGAFSALVMRFSLPSSTYATMAIREITGMDSSFATQVKLNEEYQEQIRQVKAGSKTDPSTRTRKPSSESDKPPGFGSEPNGSGPRRPAVEVAGDSEVVLDCSGSELAGKKPDREDPAVGGSNALDPSTRGDKRPAEEVAEAEDKRQKT